MGHTDFMNFEQFTDFLNEELRKGQKAAITRGDDILTDEQYAACYLNAIQALGKKEDTKGRGDTGRTRAAQKVGAEAEEDWQKISGAKLSVYLNLKPQTVSRTVDKFKLLLQGEREGTANNVIWPELIALFDKFEKMTKAAVLNLAEEAIDADADDSKYQEYLTKMSVSSKKSRDKKKGSDEHVRKEIRKTFLKLAKDFNSDYDKAAKFTIGALSKSLDADPSEIKVLGKVEFKNDKAFLKAWR